MKILNGWKEIAAHLNQGVRTVQRWEVIGLPIHRVRGRANSPVIAFAEELNDWAEHAPVRYPDLLSACNAEIKRLKRDVEYLKRELQRLKAQQRKPSH
jgi:phage terminase Nu1 subunit (DNA packaging protein)